MRQLAVVVLLVALHSVVLGSFIYLFTESFYRIIFHAQVENLFFVRQSGLFLFCLGLFYLAPLTDLQKKYRLVPIVIVTKVLAVLFLVTNAHITRNPANIFLAAFLDGLMALILIVLYRRATFSLRDCL
jgi:hypothetical protein